MSSRLQIMGLTIFGLLTMAEMEAEWAAEQEQKKKAVRK